MSCQSRCVSPRTPTYTSTATMTIKSAGPNLNRGCPCVPKVQNTRKIYSPSISSQSTFIRCSPVENKNIGISSCKPANSATVISNISPRMPSFIQTDQSRSSGYSVKSPTSPWSKAATVQILSGNVSTYKRSPNSSKSGSPSMNKSPSIQQPTSYLTVQKCSPNVNSGCKCPAAPNRCPAPQIKLNDSEMMSTNF